MTIKITWTDVLKAIGSGVIGWLVRHLLDHFNVFTKLKLAAESPEAGLLYKGFFAARYSLFDIFLVIFFATAVFLLINWVIRKFFGAARRMARAQESIRAFDRGVFNQVLLFKWDVLFNKYNKPEAVNLRPFCNRHDPPIPMPYDQPLEMYRCQQCSNKVSKPFIEAMGTYNNEFAAIRSQIQAELESRWEKLIGKK